MITNTKLDPIETASRDELHALQTQRLKWTLKHAYDNVPMYRRKFDAAGVHPDDFRELSDLSKFRVPPNRICAITIRLIPLRYRWNKLCVFMPLPVPPANRRWWAIRKMISTLANIVARSLRRRRYGKDKIHVAYGYGLFTGGLGAHYGAERPGPR